MHNKLAIISTSIFLLITFFTGCTTPKQADNEKQPPNVLFIAVDDLRPELNCYGQEHIKSPNIDKLAQEGVMFSRAYCNVPVCGASRASLMTGTRPTRNRFLGYNTWAERDHPTAVPISQHFKDNGYYTISNGKIFHHREDFKESWDEIWYPKAVGSWRNYLLPENITADTTEPKRGPAFEMAEVPDSAYFDGKIANKAIRDLRKLKDQDQPFFLAVGFLKPHLPFNAPKKYWDMYQRDDISLPTNYEVPENAPDAAIHNFGELRNYQDIPKKGPVSDSTAHTLIHGYYACVSYTDAQIGKVLTELESLGLKDNTIVILWGDHGWNLGEHTLWCKHCNFNTSLQVPLLLAGPGIPQNSQIQDLVEYVDIYPTLNELAGLSEPVHQLAGMSMVKLINGEESDWKKEVICKYFDGLSIKTDQHLYTEWSESDSLVYARMLYDHESDPKETVNIAERLENQQLVDELSRRLYQNRGADYNQKVPESESL